MKEITEIIKNKAFYISLFLPILSIFILGEAWVGMLIVLLYGFFKSRDNITAKATFTGIILVYIIFLILRFWGLAWLTDTF